MEVTCTPGHGILKRFEQHEMRSVEKAMTLGKAMDSKTAICLRGALFSTLGVSHFICTKMAKLNRPTKGER